MAKLVGHITVPVYLDWEPGQASGTLRFRLADDIVDVLDEKGKKIADVSGTFRGFYEASFNDGKGEIWKYSVSPEDFYGAFEKLHTAYLNGEATT